MSPELNRPYGRPDYYLLRFARSRETLDSPGPDYYLTYGALYCAIFWGMRKRMSESGQDWFDRTVIALQELIDHLAEREPELFVEMEAEPPKFRNWAVGVHRQVYEKTGFHKLPFHDMALIANSLFLKDILGGVGMKTTLGIVWDALPYWLGITKENQADQAEIPPVFRGSFSPFLSETFSYQEGPNQKLFLDLLEEFPNHPFIRVAALVALSMEYLKSNLTQKGQRWVEQVSGEMQKRTSDFISIYGFEPDLLAESLPGEYYEIYKTKGYLQLPFSDIMRIHLAFLRSLPPEYALRLNWPRQIATVLRLNLDYLVHRLPLRNRLPQSTV